jgi:SAM-dependent methyltransferase
VGCGNGAFLALARTAGWDGFGCDFDPTAAAQARILGFEIREGGPDEYLAHPQSFDCVTVSHVLEHVHDPRSLLETSLRLLRPGGQLYIDTPNVDALGLERYGPAWRGLEPPRHLVLFNWNSLQELLKATGYRNIRERPQPQLARAIWIKSQRIEEGHNPYDESVKLRASFSSTVPKDDAISPDRTEFVTLTAEK